MFRNLYKCVREYKPATVLTFVFIVLEAMIESVIPFITANLVNEVSRGTASGGSLNGVLKTGIILIIMAVASLSCGGIAGITSAKASAGFAKNLRHDIFAGVNAFSFENIDKFSIPSLVTRMTTDVTNVQMAFMLLIRIAVRAPLMLIFSIIMAFIMGGKLAFSFVIIVPLLAFGLIMIGKNAMPAFKRVFKKYDRLNESIEENVRGMRVVKGFAREEYEKEKFTTASNNISIDFTKAERIVAINQPLMQLCVYANLVFILLIGARLIVSSGGELINVGEISAMLTYGIQALIQLMMLSMIYVMLTMSAESAKRIDEVLSEVPVIKNPENPVNTVKDGSIEFENVSFKYDKNAENFALEKVNLKINSGMTVGIIGGTGSSKSTLVQLIPRLYDATVGNVLVGGVNVKRYDLSALRNAVAVVLQKNLIFSGTIRENLLWGNENATDLEIKEACRIAAADSFIEAFPDGYDTLIEQGGTNVSGGQKQRLCIARALLKKPKILILDDSTSAVDTKTDAEIRSSFAKFLPDTTKIIIAQRISSVENADITVVLSNGKISAVGNHEQLLENCDIYREVYQSQIKGGDEDEE